jgi:F-type H+-transporting ATPase subunit delta
VRIDSNYSYAYAKAVFSLASQTNCLEDWGNFLNCFASMMQSVELEVFCTMPATFCKKPPDELLIALFHDLNVTLYVSMVNFIRLIVVKKRLALLPHISKIYQEMFAEYSKILRVKITTVQELTADDKQRFLDELSLRYGYKIELEQEVSAALIGGAILRIKDKIIDGSVAGQMRRLRAIL